MLAAGCGYPPRMLDRSKGFGGKPIVEELPSVEEVPVKGFSISVEHRDDQGKEQSFSGELLAVDQDHLWVLVDQGPVRVHRHRITEVSLELHPSGAGWFGAWFGIGAASCISHGWFSIFSVPIWLATGIPSTVGAALGNDLDVPLDRIDELNRFARYPAGMPVLWDGRHRQPRPPRPAPAPMPPPVPASQPASQPASRPASQPAPPLPPPLPEEIDEPGMAPGFGSGSE
jgi:hypothetical protein